MKTVVFLGMGGHSSGRITDHVIVAFGGTGPTDEAAGQLIPDLGSVGFLAADTDLTCAGFAAGCLFAPKTKYSPFSFT